MCKALKFPRSTYYKALIKEPSNRELEAEELKSDIKKIWLESKSRYGAPKIQKILEGKGKKVSLKRIQRYMTDLQIRSIVVKKFKYHSEKVNRIYLIEILPQQVSTKSGALILLTFIQ